MFPIIALLLMAAEANASNFTEYQLNDVFQATGVILRRCWNRADSENKQEVMRKVQLCLQRASLVALDKVLEDDVIDLPYGIQLVKIMDVNLNNSSAHFKFDSLNDEHDWGLQVLERVEGIFQTHVLRMPMGTRTELFQGRRRHHKDSSNIILFGVMAMTIIAIPLGFQFLAVLGGKALLLAKLALILTSIQGLKKIATSDLHYGFYQGQYGGHGGHLGHGGHGSPYDRKWLRDKDRDYPDRTFDNDIPDQELDKIYHPFRPRVSLRE